MSRSRKVYLEIQEKQVLFEIYQIPQSNPFNVAILNHRLHVVKHILENEYNTDRWGLIYVVLSDVYDIGGNSQGKSRNVGAAFEMKRTS